VYYYYYFLYFFLRRADIHLGPWTKAPDGNRKQRLIRFTPPPAAHPMLKRFTSTPITPHRTRVLFPNPDQSTRHDTTRHDTTRHDTTRHDTGNAKFKEVTHFHITPNGYVVFGVCSVCGVRSKLTHDTTRTGRRL
jgi:hypothetical protein